MKQPTSNPSPETKRITLKDVADRAGVSIQAVSHVLTNNPKSRIPESTRERIRRAAEELAYEPNRMARAIQSGKTNVIAAWMPVERVSIAYLQVLQALGHRSKGSSYDLTVVALSDELALGKSPMGVGLWPADGVITLNAGAAALSYRQRHSYDKLPICVIGDEVVENGDTITWDVRGAARNLVVQMADRGRKNLWHLTHSWAASLNGTEPRIAGFNAGCDQAGLKGRLIEVPNESMDAAITALASAKLLYGTPDGITCFGDQFATAAGWWLQESGVVIPEECEVWGYGNSPNLDFLPFSVGSLKVPFQEGAGLAWDWLNERIQSPGLDHRQMTFPLEQVIHGARSS